MKLGTQLRQYREFRGLTQEELGKRAKMSAIHISHIECNRRAPSLRNFKKLIRALGLNADAMLDYV